jgi:hypothetical protein
MKTKTVKDFIRTKYAWPGGYPLYAIAADGEAICHICCKSNAKRIISNTRGTQSMCADTEWRIVAVDINYEDSQLYCANCDTRIESAYSEDEEI